MSLQIAPSKPLRNRNYPRCKEGDALTERELEILRLMCAGMLSKQIAGQLQISDKTVDNHRSVIGIKAGTLNQVQLGVWAAKQGIV